MADTNIKLLGNLLDALDRLYDNDTTVTDLHALTFATEIALTGTVHTPFLAEATRGLQKILRSRQSAPEQRDAALNLTDNLRQYLAGVVPFP